MRIKYNKVRRRNGIADASKNRSPFEGKLRYMEDTDAGITNKNDAWLYVSGEYIKPILVPGNAESKIAVEQWIRNDSKAKSDIILSITASELKQIKGCETARDVWQN